MNDRPIHRSATREQQILVDTAREEGKAEGIDIGMSISAAGLEANGFTEAARWLREAKVIERTEGQ